MVAVRLLLETGLAKVILPEIICAKSNCAEDTRRMERVLALLNRLESPSFPLALAALLREFVDSRGAAAVCGRWKLSCDDSSRVEWLIHNDGALRRA